ncbi:MAG: class I adenylate-forming enzyme family protein [Chloroflexota bacterium]
MPTEFLPLLNSYIEKWARETPDKPALIQHEDGKTVSYAQFNRLVDFFALALQDLGVQKGDRVATMLVLVPEHVLLMYACFKIGAICATLDVRLKEQEVVRDLNKIGPKVFFFLGGTPLRDFRTVGQAVKDGCPSVQRLVQFTPNPAPGELLPGALAITDLMDKKKLVWLKAKDLFTRRLAKAYAQVTPGTPALIIFTTGTTGAPKPAVLNHHTIIVQNEVLARGAQIGSNVRMLVNLPPSHVGCVTECLMTPLYLGGTAVLLRIFDAKQTLEAVQKHRLNVLGMIPTQYKLVWAQPGYDQYDLSSLEGVVYGGSSVDAAFLRRLAQMAPRFGTGLGMTEGGGFITFTPPGAGVDEMAGQVGCAFDDLAPLTVRAPMQPDGQAGRELPDGEVGEICYHPPLVFMGYYNQPEVTARVVSKEGILYSGDMGCYKTAGGQRVLFLSGRSKFIVKQSGYNVFPEEVEAHIGELPGVETTAVLGLPHDLLGEGLFAFVRPQPGSTLSAEDVQAHCKQIASYKRPQHVELWPADQPFPLTRTLKIDKLALLTEAQVVVSRLQSEGRWDHEQNPQPV